MKFTCPQTAFAKALSAVSKPSAGKTTIPILKGILMELKENTLRLTGSNLEMTICTNLQVSGEEDGSTVIDAKLLSDMVHRLPNSMLTLSAAGKKAKLQCLGSDFNFSCFDPEEFPETAAVDAVKSIDIDKKILCDMIRKTAFSACSDEQRGTLVGCLMQFSGGKLEMAALDGFRLAITRCACEDDGLQASVIVHAKNLSEMSRTLLENDDCDTVTISIDSSSILMKLGDTVMIARLLVGDFLNYNAVLPKSYNTRLIVNTRDLMAYVDRASLFAFDPKNRLIILEAADGNIDVSSKNEAGGMQGSLPCEMEGRSIRMGFNSRYLSDVLKSVDEEELVFEMQDSNSACIIKPVEGDAYTFFILPVRTVNA